MSAAAASIVDDAPMSAAPAAEAPAAEAPAAAAAAPKRKKKVQCAQPDLSSFVPSDDTIAVKLPHKTSNGYTTASISFTDGGRLFIRFNRQGNPGTLPFGVGRGKYATVNTQVELNDVEFAFCMALQDYLRNHLFEHQQHHFDNPKRYVLATIEDFFVDFVKPPEPNAKGGMYEPKLMVRVQTFAQGGQQQIVPGTVRMGADRRNVTFEDLLGDKLNPKTGQPMARRLRYTDLLIEVAYFWYGKGSMGPTILIEKLNLVDDSEAKEPVDFEDLDDGDSNAVVSSSSSSSSSAVPAGVPRIAGAKRSHDEATVSDAPGADGDEEPAAKRARPTSM